MTFLLVVGERKSLSIRLQSYNPGNVRCGHQSQRYGEDICGLTLDIMADSTTPQIFGPKGASRVTVALPYIIQAGQFLFHLVYIT